MTAKDSIDNYREVTEAGKTALEKSDAKWIEPPQSFIDSVTAKGVVYNSATGFFELNGLNDLSYKDMLEIDKYGVMHARYNENYYLLNNRIRTNYPPMPSIAVENYSRTFVSCTSLEVAAVRMMYTGTETFTHCSNLRLIKSFHGIREKGLTDDIFRGCDKLERIEGFKFGYMNKDCTVNLQSVPCIDLWTLTNLVASKKEEWKQYEVTVTVHPDVYAKLTDEANAEWFQVFNDAAGKNITFTTP